MKCIIGDQEYQFLKDFLHEKNIRLGYFQLAKQIFRLDFDKWYQSKYWDNRFIPYIIMEADKVVSSVAVCINDISLYSQRKRHVQISTVMTLPEFRNKGLNRFLMETILSEWVDKCDAIYLLANDSVVNLYPKFNFEEFKEFQFSKSISKTNGAFRKLNIEDPNDWNLILEKYKFGNPFSEINVDNLDLFVFHCLHSFSKDIYFLEKYDAVVIVQFENDKLICYDIFSDGEFPLDEILSIMANTNTKIATLGFTPKWAEDYVIEESQELDTHLFVLTGKDNIFKNKKVMMPILSRA